MILKRHVARLRGTGVGVHLERGCALAKTPSPELEGGRLAVAAARRPSARSSGGLSSYLALATGLGDVHEAAGVDYPLAGAALGDLGLLLLLDLGGLRLDLTCRTGGRDQQSYTSTPGGERDIRQRTGTGEGSVNLSHDCDLFDCSY